MDIITAFKKRPQKSYILKIVLLCIIVFTVSFVSVPVFIYLLSCFETPYKFFPTFIEAEGHGLPSDFPVSAYNLHLEYNIDSNAMWIIFNATPSDADSMSRNMLPFGEIDYEFERLVIPDGKVLRYDKLNKDRVSSVFIRQTVGEQKNFGSIIYRIALTEYLCYLKDLKLGPFYYHRNYMEIVDSY